MDVPPVRADLALPEYRVVRRQRLHRLNDLGAIGRVLRLRDGFDEVCGRAVHAGMHVVRVFTLRMRGRKALCKIARRIVRIPRERLDRLHALRGFQPKRRHVLEAEH